jgi:hypothetical protein
MLPKVRKNPADKHFLLVAADADRDRLAEPSAYEIAAHMLREKKWPLKARTPHRNEFSCGSKLVIYAAGKRENGGCIIAFAEVAAPPKPVFAQGVKWCANDRFTKHLAADFVVSLRHCELLAVPLPLRELRQEMSFVSNPESPKWGNRLQTGVVALSASDHQIICKLNKSKLRSRSGLKKSTTVKHS